MIAFPSVAVRATSALNREVLSVPTSALKRAESGNTENEKSRTVVADVLLGAETPATNFKKYFKFPEGTHVVFVGFGSIGQGTLPLIFRHFDVSPSQVMIVTADDRGKEIAERYGVKFMVTPLKPNNYKEIMTPLLTPGSFCLNLSVDVSSNDLMLLCRELESMYLDTCTEPWAGEYNNPNLSASERSNYALRLSALALKEEMKGGPTAVVTHGANPGLVSHFVKQALLNIARDTDHKLERVPATRQEWAQLACDLDIKTIHIAERDTQVATVEAAKKPHEFVNTWSCDGFISEGCYQPSELGWGTHEKEFPHDGHRHNLAASNGAEAPSIFLTAPGGSTKVRTWTPNYGAFTGFIVTHAESISISEYLSVQEEDKTVYRPTVHYAYHPCDYAVMSVHEMMGAGFVEQPVKRVLQAHEIVTGMDELGVLLMGHKKGAYWYGSQLTIEEAKKLAPFQNATGLQVTSTIIGAMVWAFENPRLGMVEPDEIDFSRVLQVARPYLGNLVGHYSDWTPLKTRGPLSVDDVDPSDPWQFKNFRVNY